MFQRLFYGRNGFDPLSIFILILAIPFLYNRLLWIIALLLIGYALFRCFSRNIDKRRRELYGFMNLLRRISLFFTRIFKIVKLFFNGVHKIFATWGMRWKQRKEYVFVKCPHCKKLLRLPRHKGTIMVTCTVCRHEFKKKT